MKIQQYHCLLQATFSSSLLLLLLLSITATYAIASAPQAEVSAPAQQIAPRPLKFGEKLAQNEVYQPTLSVTQQLGNTENAAGREDRRRGSARGGNRVQNDRDPQNSNRRQPESRGSPQQTSSRNDNILTIPLLQDKQRKETRSRSGTRRHPEPEYISLPTHAPPETSSHLARRHNAGSSRQNQLVGPHYEIPAVQKIPETTIYKTITPVVGGQQPAPPQPQTQKPAAIAANSNRSRFTQTIVEPPNRSHELNYQQHQLVTAVATTKRPKSSSPSRTNSHKNSQHAASPPTTTTTSRNSNHNASSRSSNSNRNHNEVNKPSSVPRVPVTAPSDERRRAPTKIVTTTAANGQVSQKNASANHSGRSSPPNNARKSSSSSSSSTATTTTPRSLFSLPNEYNIFSPAFWSFLNPTTRATHSSSTSRTRTASYGTTTTKKPPKKYIPPQQTPTKEEKLNYSKAKPVFQPTKEITTTTTTPSPPYQVPSEYTNDIGPPNRKEEGPFRIALPTFNILGQRRNTGDGSPSDKDKRNVDDDDADLRAKFNCPRESEVRFQLFPKICKIDDDCRVWNRGEICCEIFGAKSCVSGIPKPLEETSHSPILGLIARKCPDRPLAELWWEVKECETDMDCWPRVCCPDGRRRYCRTSQPELNTVPVPVQRSFNYLTEYLECTAPPPPIFDLHPKACTSTLDCFPNVCCQEAGLRHCRPPKKSVLTMLANVFNVDLVKRLTQNIVIK